MKKAAQPKIPIIYLCTCDPAEIQMNADLRGKINVYLLFRSTTLNRPDLTIHLNI